MHELDQINNISFTVQSVSSSCNSASNNSLGLLSGFFALLSASSYCSNGDNCQSSITIQLHLG